MSDSHLREQLRRMGSTEAEIDAVLDLAAQPFLPPRISFSCVCCGFTREFADAEEAFNEGWDAPPHFTGYISCDLCPAAFIMTGQMHKHDSVHERWKVEGRPSEWSQETCLAPTDRVPETELDKIRKMLGT